MSRHGAGSLFALLASPAPALAAGPAIAQTAGGWKTTEYVIADARTAYGPADNRRKTTECHTPMPGDEIVVCVRGYDEDPEAPSGWDPERIGRGEPPE